MVVESIEEQRTKREISNANLIPIKPGETLNPGGRPKGKSITAELRKLLDKGTTAEELADILVKMSRKDLASLKEVIDRTDGKVADKRLNINISVTPESLQVAQERLLKAQGDTQALLERYPGKNEPNTT